MNAINLIGLVILAVLSKGLVLTVLWKWFVLPLFPMIPPLTIPVAIGMALIVDMLRYRVRRKEDDPEFAFVMANALLTPWIFLAMGWIVHLFI